MPANLSRDGMITHIKELIDSIQPSDSKDSRAEKCHNVLSYILTHFDHFKLNFYKSKFIFIVRNKCFEFIDNENVVGKYDYLINTAVLLLEKLDEIEFEDEFKFEDEIEFEDEDLVG